MIRILTLLALTAPLASQTETPQNDLEVHEWGTFTSMVGADGTVLEGLQHEEERLPAFVHELAELSEINGGGERLLKFPATRVTQKMETPVIYFHTETPRTVTVDVRFPNGLLTQFYPVPFLVAPALDEQLRTPVDLSGVDDAFLRWRVDLIPFDHAPPAEIPACDPDDPWSFARQVRCAYVRTSDPDGIRRATEAEHYLFYRGLARFRLPFGLEAGTDGTGTFRNDCGSDVPFAAVLDMNGDGGRFLSLGVVHGRAAKPFDFGDAGRDPDRERIAAALGARVFEALLDQGLFEDEARAMIATWSRSWFQTDGTRVIYVLPRSEVDRVLPLHIDPAPAKLVRVLVGRLEFIPPEVEAAVERALEQRVAEDHEARQHGLAYLAKLDRFLEPHVRRALQRTDSELARRSAREVLAELAAPGPSERD